MTITYPLALPSAPGFRTSRFEASNVVGMTASPFTYSQQVYVHQGARWAATLTLPPMKRAQAAAWCAFLVSLRGSYGTFLLGDPDAKTPQGVATGTPLVNGADQTGSQLVTDGWTAGQTGILKAGDYLQLGSGATSRLHMVLQDADSDGSGNATFDIWPPLRESPANNDPIVVSQTQGVFRLSTPDVGWDANEISVFGVSFAAIEALTV